MKNISKMILPCAGILLALAGCQKGNENGKEADLVRFNVASVSPATKTAYSGDGTFTGKDENKVLTWERIDWKSGDQILAWSDEAVDRLGNGKKSSKYNIGTITAKGEQSIADVADWAGTGLIWTKDVDNFKFSGSYGNFTATDGENGYPVSLTASIPDSQAIDAEGYPDMNNAFMLARPVSVAAHKAVDLQFDPYFTAFQLNVSSKDEIKIKSVTLKSEKRLNGANTFGPTPVSGAFTAEMELADETPAWAVTVPEVTESSAKTIATFATPLELKKANATDAKTNEVKFVIFAVPQDIESLTMDFEVETTDGETLHRRATITYAKTENGHEAGDPVTFGARKKHNIKGIVLDDIRKDIELVLQVVEWTDETGEVYYVNGESGDAIANAVALEFASGAAVTSGGGRRRNNYFANSTDPIKAYFSVFAPVGGTWKIKVSGATDKFKVTGPDGTTGTEITGPIGSRVDFTIERNGATASDFIQLDFLAVTADGREMSINSEVTRANALTITGQVANE